MGQFDKLPYNLLHEDYYEYNLDSALHEGEILLRVLKSFGVQADLTEIRRLALCNSYDIKLRQGIKVAKLKRIIPDLELSLHKAICIIEQLILRN